MRLRMDSDPPRVFENLKAPDMVLDEKCDGTHIRMGLKTQCKMRLRTSRVVAYSNVLIKFPDSILNARSWQSQRL
jgi:hypothetical protein